MFDVVIGSDICPEGTRVLFLANENLVTHFGTVVDGCLGENMTWKDVRAATGLDSRQSANRLHFVPPNETRPIGLSAAMVRSGAVLEILKERQGIMPKYLRKLWCAYTQGYTDRRDKTMTFCPVSGPYNHCYPDNMIYDLDHVVPKYMHGSESLANSQAITLASHRLKSNKESAHARKLRAAPKSERCVLRHNKRYWLRNTRARKYV